MKILKYLTYSLALMLLLASCDKHEMKFVDNEVVTDMAEFQLHYFEPIANTAANYIDSVFVNGVLYSSVNGSGQLVPYNGVPGGGIGKFFTVKPGDVNFKFYRKGNIVYDQNVNLTKGKQNVIVHDMDLAPIVIDNGYPYQHTSGTPSVATWDTDSLETVKFVNLLYENATTPYPGKLQYQWKNPRTKEWENLGNPVAFGEATERAPILIVKTTHNSSGSCRIDYRILTEDGEVLQVANSGGKMVNYSDYWTGYIGRSYMHFFRGIRTGSPTCAVSQWTSL
jgi:hypothetical protein